MTNTIDVATNTTGRAHDLQRAGIENVGLYARTDRTSLSMVQGLHSIGMKVFTAYERGDPTSVSYFSPYKGGIDAVRALSAMSLIQMPKGKEVFFTVDYDAKPEDLPKIEGYFGDAQKIVKAAGYLCSVYGSGLVCAYLVNKGLAHSGWLSGSTGWTGFQKFKPHASIVQTALDQTFLGLDVDFDIIQNPSVLW